MTLLAVFGVVIALVILALLRGKMELNRSVGEAQASFASLKADDVPALVAEGEQVLRDKLKVTLAEGLDEAAQQLDVLTRSPRIKEAFARPELYWNFARPLGALMGELIRRHGQARWVDHEQGVLLRVTLRDGRELTSHPFDRIIRHRLSGRPGELAAYITFAAAGPSADKGSATRADEAGEASAAEADAREASASEARGAREVPEAAASAPSA